MPVDDEDDASSAVVLGDVVPTVVSAAVVSSGVSESPQASATKIEAKSRQRELIDEEDGRRRVGRMGPA